MWKLRASIPVTDGSSVGTHYSVVVKGGDVEWVRKRKCVMIGAEWRAKRRAEKSAEKLSTGERMEQKKLRA